MSPDGREREKAEVSVGLTPSTPKIIPLISIYVWYTLSVGLGYAKTPRQSPHGQVEATLLLDVQLRQE